MLKKYPAFILMSVTSHWLLIGIALTQYVTSFLGRQAIWTILLLFTLIFWVFLHLYLTPNDIGVSMRSRIMAGGRRLMLMAWNNLLLQIPLCIASYHLGKYLGIAPAMLWTDIAIACISVYLVALNGTLRIIFTSRRLRLVKRLILLFTMLIPIVNLIMAYYCAHIVKDEYGHDCNKTELQNIRRESQICRTKYPLLMLHGIGFRDYKYVNYWGRIPKLLIKNGATIYYGHQCAWGTIENCAAEIKEELIKIIEETGCEKVNIIAHSKGGLDARYLISSLDMGEHVASLTTIATPHHGSQLLTELNKLSDKTYRKVSNLIDKYFRKLGDTNPDCYNSSKQLLPEATDKFNEENPDVPDVYYQSYAAVMKNAGSDHLLSVPYSVMRWVAGNNDGLVTVGSAVWGNFQGVIASGKRRGISHGDLIDLKREDIKGLDITEKYVEIVAKLKNMGF